MKKKIKIVLAVLFFTIGISIFIFPYITDKKYKEEIKTKEQEYIEKINNITNTNTEQENINIKSNLEDLFELLKIQNQDIYNSKQEEFLYHTNYERNSINLTNYGLNDNIFGFLELPTIGITLPIYLGSSNYNMKLGATHLTGTSYPIGGINTNSVIAAHRGYYRTTR